ncbi:MAG: triose-phosphate isomerase [Candidatus Fermentibacteraceae bacterium]
MIYPYLDESDLAGRRVFLRADLNVPLEKGRVADDTRLTTLFPTLLHLLQGGASVILASHLGRPKGKPDPELSLEPVARRLEELLGVRVLFAPDCVGERVKTMAAGLRPGDILLLENLRFHAAEKAGDAEFASRLASLADVYVNDAFATCHRAHASMSGVPEAMGGGYIGFLVRRELEAFEGATKDPDRPLTLVMGGAKVSDKVAVLEHLVPRVDRVLIGGAMAFTFLRAKGMETGKSLVEKELADTATRIMELADSEGTELVLPRDFVAAPSPEEPDSAKTVAADAIPEDMAGYDIGPETVEAFSKAIADSGTVIWNGPMGMFEVEGFDVATRGIAEAMAGATDEGAATLVGGGDSARAIAEAGCAGRVSFVSTGGGASLTLLQGQELPALKPLRGGVPPLRYFMGGNWKMNGTPEGALSFLEGLSEGGSTSLPADVVIFPPFTLISAMAAKAWGAGVTLGGQDLYHEEEGAFTGEVSAGMLADAGCCWFLAGHSERRHVLGEDDEAVRLKLEAGLRAGLRGVLCVGELLSDREDGRTEEVVRRQIESALEGLDCWSPGNLVVAYEPVWAIGTGKTATPEEANRMHALIRGWLAGIAGDVYARETRIVYGGSVKPRNAREILAGQHVNGALVGGASLRADSFADIIRATGRD